MNQMRVRETLGKHILTDAMEPVMDLEILPYSPGFGKKAVNRVQSDRPRLCRSTSDVIVLCLKSGASPGTIKTWPLKLFNLAIAVFAASPDPKSAFW